MPSLQIPHHYHGPPTSGNGGFTCGLIDAHTDYLSEITLRKPIPLDRDLRLEVTDGGHQLLDGHELIATARPGDLSDLDIPEPPNWEAAVQATSRYIGFTKGTAFPTCYVCGENRYKGDGLHVYAGVVADRDIYAAAWQTTPYMADHTSYVRPELVWAALDCPGAYAAIGQTPKTVVLGRMTAELLTSIKAGDACIVIAWLIKQEGRKSWSGTAVFNGAGRLCGRARSIWFEL